MQLLTSCKLPTDYDNESVRPKSSITYAANIIPTATGRAFGASCVETVMPSQESFDEVVLTSRT